MPWVEHRSISFEFKLYAAAHRRRCSSCPLAALPDVLAFMQVLWARGASARADLEADERAPRRHRTAAAGAAGRGSLSRRVGRRPGGHPARASEHADGRAAPPAVAGHAPAKGRPARWPPRAAAVSARPACAPTPAAPARSRRPSRAPCRVRRAARWRPRPRCWSGWPPGSSIAMTKPARRPGARLRGRHATRMD